MNVAWLEHRRKSCAQAAALALAAAVMLVPANVLPVLTTNLSGELRTDTIFSGTVGLAEDGLWVLAAIVFTASILIPFLKLAGLAWLLRAAHRGAGERAARLTKLYGALDFIGRWSMLDVFLAAFLAGVVQFGSLAKVEPRPGIVAFAAAVVLTMLATHTFDPRILWDEPPAETSDDEFPT
jgi:paraquat-inducible protein A